MNITLKKTVGLILIRFLVFFGGEMKGGRGLQHGCGSNPFQNFKTMSRSKRLIAIFFMRKLSCIANKNKRK